MHVCVCAIGTYSITTLHRLACLMHGSVPLKLKTVHILRLANVSDFKFFNRKLIKVLLSTWHCFCYARQLLHERNNTHNHSEMKNERLVILTHAAMWRGTTCFPWQVSY